jgi:hypothetical protein
MSEYKELLESLQTLKINNKKQFNEFLETLNVIVVLMNEIGSNRFNSSTYTRHFNHDRLEVVINFKKSL